MKGKYVQFKMVICCWMATSLQTIVYVTTIILLVFIQPAEGAIGAESIFGVRWFLGEKFRFQPPLPILEDEPTNCHLMLMFNTHQSWESLSFSVEVGGADFACKKTKVQQTTTSDHHPQFNDLASKKGDIFITYIHKCPVTFASDNLLEKFALMPYSIFASSAEQKKQTLFQSALRSPVYAKVELSMVVLGDWGLITNFSKQFQLSEPITDCLHGQIDQKENIRLLLLLGDLAYDLEGQTYVNFLTQLSDFSSQIVMLLTPGNHQSIRHEDIYQLVKESFYSPMWSRFFGYFDLLFIRDHIFLGYSSQHLFPWLNRTSHSSLFQIALKEEYQNFPNMFAQQFPPETKTKMRQKTVIAFSHYPTYCSKQNELEDCSKYKDLQEQFSKELQDLGADIFFTGHVHMYERTKQICIGTNRLQAGVAHRNEVSQFWAEKDCSIFVLEGSGGNNYFVETDKTLQLKDHSQKFVGNTGFGILSLNSNIVNDIHFAHISVADKCLPMDQFILHVNRQEVVIQAGLPTSFWLAGLIIFLISTTAILKRKKLKQVLTRFKRRRFPIPTATVQLSEPAVLISDSVQSY